MKIDSITTNIYKSNPSANGSQIYKTSLLINSDCFEKKKFRPSFGDWCVNSKKFNVLDCSESTLTEIGEVFHNQSDSKVQEVCDKRYKNGFIDFFTESGQEKYKRAYNRFIPYVRNARSHKNSVLNEINKLNVLALKGDSNIGEQKYKLKKGFMTMLEIEQQGKKVPVQNGILLYGDARDADKNEFIEWIKKEANASFDEVTYKEEAPFESIKNIVKKAEEAEKVFNFTGKRTILYVKNIDKLLTDEDNDYSLKMIARFKSFAEYAHENYHTTLLIKTNRSLDDFEEASIGSQRFETKIKLKDGITPEGKERLKKAEIERDRLEKAAGTFDEYYYYEYEDSSNSNDRDVEGGQWGDFCDYWKYS